MELNPPRPIHVPRDGDAGITEGHEEADAQTRVEVAVIEELEGPPVQAGLRGVHGLKDGDVEPPILKEDEGDDADDGNGNEDPSAYSWQLKGSNGRTRSSKVLRLTRPPGKPAPPSRKKEDCQNHHQ
jgi:hypothetical protein